MGLIYKITNKVNGKILALLFISIFLISFASAMTIDNIKTQQKGIPFQIGDKVLPENPLWEKYPNIEIINGFNLGRTLFKGSLTSHTESCSDNCESVMDIQHDGGVLIEGIRFTSQPEEYSIYISDSSNNVKISDYDNQCVNDIYYPNNNSYSQKCSRVKTGIHIEEIPIWREYKVGEELNSGTYKLKIEGKINLDTETDWQIKVQGKWITEWAIWDSTVKQYYKMDETTGTTSFDSTGNVNGTANNARVFTSLSPGIINTGADFTQGSDYIDYGDISWIDSTSELTISLWVNFSTFSTRGTLIAKTDGVGPDDVVFIIENLNTGKFRFLTRDAADNENEVFINSTATLNTGQYYHIVAVLNSTTIALFIDDVEVNKTSRLGSGNFNPNANHLVIGRYGDYNGYYFNGTIDEVGLWNTSLSRDEISTLYNGGDGLPYGQTTSLVTVTQNSPIDGYTNYYTDENIINLNCSFNATKSKLLNASIYSNYSGTWTKLITSTYTTETQATLIYNYTLGTSLTPKSFDWYCESYNNESLKFESSNRTIKQEDIQFVICNSTYNVSFLNISFKNEDDLTSINASIPTSTFSYYLGDGSVYKNYTYVNSTESPTFTFCASPTNRNFYVNSQIQYKGTNYPQRIYDPDVLTYANSTTNTTLYLLSDTDGIYVTFQLINTASNTLSGVDVTAVREISGEDVTVANGLTGDSGLITFWLNPDFSHDFSFVKTGYESYSYSDYPTQTSYTITLSGGTSIPSSYSKGVIREIYPEKTSLINNTDYTFGFYLISTYWDIEEYGFNLRLNNGTTLSGGSTGTEGTNLTLNFNTNNLTKIYFDYYWVINGTYTNGTLEYKIFNTDKTQWSIKTFFTDLDNYLDSGIFGIDDFGRYLFIFLAILLSSGILIYKFGVSSPSFLTGIVFFIILFLDVGVGLIPTLTVLNGVSINYLLTIISGIIFLITVLGEVYRS